MESNHPLDDSVHILYEKIEPRPEIEIVDEIVSTSEENMPPAPQSFIDICEDSSENPILVQSNEDDSISILENNRAQSDIFCVYRIPPESKTSKRGSSENSKQVESNVDDSTSMLESNNKVESKMRTKKVPQKENISENSTKDSKIKCGICFDGPEEMSNSQRTLGSTVCGHLFCSSCMETSRKNSSQCPTCRKKLTKNGFHPIYF